MKRQNLVIKQVEQKMKVFKELKSIVIPDEGWVKSIRTALKITLKQLGKKLNITPQSVREIEQREKSGAISLNILRKFGEALDMKLVYGFIPKHQTLNEIINQRAYEVAKTIVMRTSKTMELEDQKVKNEQLEKAIEAKQEEIVREMPKYLWD